MSQNADLFMEMARGQKRRDLDPAVMANTDIYWTRAREVLGLD